MSLIKLAYVHQYRDRHGQMRRYVRIPGRRSVVLPGLPGSPEFMDAYRAALANPPPAPNKSRRAAGTLGALVEQFYGSAEFANLKPSSKRLYRLAIEAVALHDGHRLVHDMPADKARKVIEEIGSAKPGMANLTRSVLRRLFEYAITIGARTDNPFARVPTYKLGTHHTWTDAELDAFEKRWKVGTRERLTYAVLLYTMQRIGDAVRIRRPDIRHKQLHLKQQKTGAELVIAIHPELARAIRAGDARGVYLLGDAAGRPVTANALSKMMATAIERAGLPEECVAHGLRKAGMRRLAEHGSTAHEIGAVSGHRSLAEIELYTAKADQARLAREAIRKLPGKR